MCRRWAARRGRPGPGETFGERALLTSQPHNTSAMAETDVDVWTLSKADFDMLMNRFPTLAISMSRILSQRLSQVTAMPAAPVGAAPGAPMQRPAGPAGGCARPIGAAAPAGGRSGRGRRAGAAAGLWRLVQQSQWVWQADVCAADPGADPVLVHHHPVYGVYAAQWSGGGAACGDDRRPSHGRRRLAFGEL